MVFVEKADKVPVLAIRESLRIDDTKSCLVLTVTPVAVLNWIELVKIPNVEIVLGRFVNPPPVVTPIIEDA